jgi:hypothetical protein
MTMVDRSLVLKGDPLGHAYLPLSNFSDAELMQ